MLTPSPPPLKQFSKLENGFLLRLVISGMGILFLTWLSVLMQLSHPSSFSYEIYYWTGLALTTPILYYTAQPLVRSWLSLKNFRFSIEIPLISALAISYLYSLYATLFFSENNYAYFDSILFVLFIVYTGRYLEAFCRKRIAKILLKFMSPFIDGTDNSFPAGIKNDLSLICEPYFPTKPSHGNTANKEGATPPNKYSESSPCDHIALWHLMITLTLAAAIYCWWLPFDNKFALFCTNCALLITCPCAIAIAYPLVVACVLETGARKGILIRNPNAFFKLNEVEYLLFDKIGTLTEGNLVVDHVEYINHASAQSVLPLIALIEKNTHHPIAYAIVQYTAQQFNPLNLEVHRLKAFPGNGVRALVNGKFIFIGSARWLRKNGIFIPDEIIAAQDNHAQPDRIFVHCAIGGIEVARIQLKEQLRQDACEMIHFLKKRHIEMSVLSGESPDMSSNTQALPLEKEAQVICLQDLGYVTALIGDGLNDAFALQRADIGIVMGVRNPVSSLCADIILQQPCLKLMQTSFLLSAYARKILKQNYLLCLGFHSLMLPFAAVGRLNAVMILTSLALSTLMVMGNTVRIKFGKL